jgi:hypothetical protein
MRVLYVRVTGLMPSDWGGVDQGGRARRRQGRKLGQGSTGAMRGRPAAWLVARIRAATDAAGPPRAPDQGQTNPHATPPLLPPAYLHAAQHGERLGPLPRLAVNIDERVVGHHLGGEGPRGGGSSADVYDRGIFT